MKKELSSLEVHYLVKELKAIENSRIDRIYQPVKETLILQLHKTGVGKMLLRVSGKFIYLTDFKEENPQTPLGFCTYLRKKLSNAVLKEIRQLHSERIVEIILDTKDQRYKIIIELFGTGNIILADENSRIMSPLHMQKFKDREIRSGENYVYPGREYDFLNITEEILSELLGKSGQDSVVKSLAIDLGLGGIYAEELCLITGIDKDKKPSSSDASKLISGLKKIISKDINPLIIKDKDEIVDITPFELERYSGIESVKAETFNKALDSILTEKMVSKAEQETKKIESKAYEKVRKSIEIQEKNIEKLRKEAGENQRKGEAIYENYELVKSFIDELLKAREKHSWKEIKERLKGHKLIKEINDKESRIIVEI